MAEVAAKKDVTKFYIKTVVFFVLMFGIGLLPAPEPLTPYGMKAIGIFVGLIFGWCAIGMIWPSIVGILAMAALGILPMSQVLATGWGSPTMLLIFFMMMLSKNLEQAGISNFIARWFISRKFAIGRPWLLSYMLLIAIALISTLTSAVATILLGWAIFYGVASEIKAQKYDQYTTYMVIGIVLAASLGNGLFPFRTVGIVAFALMEQISGYALNDMLYTVWAFTMCFIMLAIYLLMGKFIFKIDVSALKAIDKDYFSAADLSLDKSQKVLLGLMLLLVVLMLAPSVTPADWIINVIYNNITATGIAALMCLLMCIIHIGGKPLMEPKRVIRDGVSFDVMFLGATILPLANGVFSSEEAGINAFLSQHLAPIVEGKPIFIFLALAVIIATIVTNFVIDVTVPTILFPAFYPIGVVMGVPPVPLMVLIVYACYMALLMPSASPMAAMMFGNSEWVRTKDIYRYCGAFILVAMILCCLNIPIVVEIFS